MDVFCATCGEPWDSDHLRFDEVWEWDLPEEIAHDFIRNPRFSEPDDRVRLAAERAGWKFAGNSPMAIVCCPSCKGHTALTDAGDRIVKTKIAAHLLGDDKEGLIAELGDL
jgi:hypothetical protein